MIVEIQGSQPGVEPLSAWAGRAFLLHRSDVPLAEVGGVVASLFQCLGDGDFVWAHVVAVVEYVGAHRGAPGHHAGAGGGADRGTGVESIKHNGLLRHRVEVGSF